VLVQNVNLYKPSCTCLLLVHVGFKLIVRFCCWATILVCVFNFQPISNLNKWNKTNSYVSVAKSSKKLLWFYKLHPRFPASRGPFSFLFAELTDGTKRDLCHGSKWTVLSMRHGYLATEMTHGAFSTWSADDSHLSQPVRQKTPAQFGCHEWRVHQNPKKVDSLSRDSCCLIYGINFKLSGQRSFFNMTTTPGIKENLTHWRLRVLWSLH